MIITMIIIVKFMNTGSSYVGLGRFVAACLVAVGAELRMRMRIGIDVEGEGEIMLIGC